MSQAFTLEEWVKIRRASQAAMLDMKPAGKLPDVLLAYQSRAISLLETTGTNVLIVEKSRRIGFTWGLAAYAVLRAAREKSAGGMDAMYISYSQEMTREFVDACAMWAKAFSFAAMEESEYLFSDVNPEDPSDTREIKAFRIRFASGFEIIALSSAPRSLRGKQGVVIIDEAAFVESIGELMKAALAFLMWGGQVIIVSTHNGETNPFNEMVSDVRSGRRPYKLMRIDFDEALKEGLYQRICMVTGKEWSPEREAEWRQEIIAFYGDGADEELFCIPSQGSGVWLSTPLIEARMDSSLPVLRLTRPDSFTWAAPAVREADIQDWCREKLDPVLENLNPALDHVFGMDFGRTADRSVIVPLAIEKSLVRRAPFILEMLNIPFEQQRQVLFYMGQRLPRLRAGKLDSTGNGAYLGEVAAQKWGASRIEQVKLSEEWYRNTMPRVKRHFDEATVVLPRDADIRGDLQIVRTIRGVARVPDLRTKATDGGKRHGDAAVAIALALAASEADPVFYEYRAAPPGAASDSNSTGNRTRGRTLAPGGFRSRRNLY